MFRVPIMEILMKKKMDCEIETWFTYRRIYQSMVFRAPFPQHSGCWSYATVFFASETIKLGMLDPDSWALNPEPYKDSKP